MKSYGENLAWDKCYATSLEFVFFRFDYIFYFRSNDI